MKDKEQEHPSGAKSETNLILVSCQKLQHQVNCHYGFFLVQGVEKEVVVTRDLPFFHKEHVLGHFDTSTLAGDAVGPDGQGLGEAQVEPFARPVVREGTNFCKIKKNIFNNNQLELLELQK